MYIIKSIDFLKIEFKSVHKRPSSKITDDLGFFISLHNGISRSVTLELELKF